MTGLTREFQVYARPYQVEGLEALWNYFANGGTGNPLVAMPTGTGKSLLPPLFMQRAFQEYPSSRMAMLTHVKELVEQNRKALERVWPTAPVGIYSAGLSRKEAFAPIVFGSIQSANRSIKDIGWRDIIFIDEAQLLNPRRSSMYQQAIDESREINPNVKIVGLTATPFRMGQGLLTDPTYDSEGNMRPPIFTDIVFDITGLKAFNRLIDECYLAPLVPRPTSVVIDVSDVRELAGDFVQSELNAAIKKQNITKQALAESWAIASDRKSWIVFGAGIENCESIATIMNEMGISACCVHSKMKGEDRDAYIEAFKAGRFRAIVSNNILTTGFDHPQVDCIIDLRPTTSVVLHVQKYGRGTRPYFHPSFNFEQLRHFENRKLAIEMGGKHNCIVLDFAGNTNRLGPINDPRIPKKKGKGTGEVPIKICPECGAYNHTTARFCCDDACNYEFIFKTKIKSEASTAEIIRRYEEPEPEIEILDVSIMNGYLHRKEGKTDKVRVQYFCGIQSFNVWLGFEPDEKGFVKHKSREWFRQHSAGEIPQSTQEALDRFGECRQTRQLKVNMAGKYPEIIEFLF